ncbi:autophagy protein Apg9 [Dictyocaulus viviparus]|uniref:Autophagy-related protein 9 n=1 Tax=Dictyocaulus viviparus TaxID=29172 RepID=A0A0D8X9G8_DICVI|nr:autophagy protein Apg9 [Dictyocaulus viviparus]
MRLLIKTLVLPFQKFSKFCVECKVTGERCPVRMMQQIYVLSVAKLSKLSVLRYVVFDATKIYRRMQCFQIFYIICESAMWVSKSQKSYQSLLCRISGSSTPCDGYHSPPTNHVVGNPRQEECGLNPAPSVMSSSLRRNNHRWDHIEDPDKVPLYTYFYASSDFTFSTFFTQCIDYDVLFANKNISSTGAEITGKRSFNDAVIENCSSHLHPLVVLSILVAIAFWISRVIKTTYYLLQLHEIQLFYRSELHVNDAQLSNLTWHSVVKRICDVQKRLQLIVDREHVTPIDLYNRILRFKNYLVALVNMKILPPSINMPFFGCVPYFPNGLKSNLRRILFFGSTSPFTGPYLKTEYKDLDNLETLARQMEKDVAMYGFLNMVFFPLIFLYQVLFSFFTLSELIKRRPDALGMRRYSNYGRYRVRHFNELNHELAARLNRSHIYANAYLNQFYSNLTEIFAKNVAFVAGAIAGVLAILSAWDEDVLQVEHVLTVISICGVIILVCHGLISDENLVWQPEVLLTNVASELHYVPSEWKGKAHTEQVRREFEQLFQLKWVFLLHELSSPILTPFILLFWIRPNCRELVKFFHDNTVRVDGLGDVCSFALMDVARHGDGKWNGSISKPTSACDGKTELSALHFATTNPEWKPPLARNGLQKVDGPLDSINSGILYTLCQANPDAVNSLTRSLHNSCENTLFQMYNFMSCLSKLRLGINMDTVGADMRIKTLFLRGIHDESLRRSSMTTADYGTSIAPNHMQSIFGVPQPSQMEESAVPEDESGSRLVLHSNLPGTDEENQDHDCEHKDDNEDDDGPPQFMNV